MVSYCFACTSPSTAIEKKSFSNEIPPDTIQLLGTKIISTKNHIRDISISPTNDELFFTLVSPKNTISSICRMEKNNGEWSSPEIANFSGNYSDLEPAFSPDGEKLFFASNRPRTNGEDPKDFDIFYVEKNRDGWDKITRLDTFINTSGNEFYPSVALNGNLYFTASFKNGKGREDIFRSDWKNGKYSKPVSLDTAINSKYFEFNAYISPDEQFLIFSSYGRPDDIGGGDLYISAKNKNGNWTPAKNMGENFNSEKLDFCPFVSFDQKAFYFSSEKTEIEKYYPEALNYNDLLEMIEKPMNGTSNIFWVNFDLVKQQLSEF